MLRVTLLKLAFLLMLCLCMTGGRRGVYYMTESTGGIGIVPLVATQTLFDDFTDDATAADWDEWPADSGCTIDGTNDELDIDNNIPGGSCHYDQGVSPDRGGDPTTPGAYGYFHTNTTAGTFNGVGLRVEEASAPGPTDFSYIVRCGNTTLEYRVCGQGSNCSTFHNGEACNIDDGGDGLGWMVFGTDTATEFCVWIWESADAPGGDPDDWGDPLECVSNDGNFPLLDADYVGAGTVKATWCSASEPYCTTGDPTDFADGGVGFRGVIAYCGTGTCSPAEIRAGEVQ